MNCLDHDFRIETHFERRTSPHERAAEDAAGKARDVVSLERLERHHRDLRGVGDLAQRQTPALARRAQHPANIACVLLCSHRPGQPRPYVRKPISRCQTAAAPREPPRPVPSPSASKQTDRRHSGGARPRHGLDSVHRHAANRENRHRDSPDDRGEPVQAEMLAQAGLRRSSETRCRRSGSLRPRRRDHGLVGAANRSSDQKAGGRHRPRARRPGSNRRAGGRRLRRDASATSSRSLTTTRVGVSRASPPRARRRAPTAPPPRDRVPGPE